MDSDFCIMNYEDENEEAADRILDFIRNKILNENS
jgi:hypothetical protein